MSLKNKHIVVAVTGSIAAYKSADLVRRLIEAGAEVRVIMTTAAAQFITPLTLQTLSGHPVAMELLDADQESTMGHIALARWADWILIAPASADTIARLSVGRADDLLTAMVLATSAPIAIAPAMNNKMWSHPLTQNNIAILKQQGVVVIGPASGDQACGEQGEGRLVEPPQIVSRLASLVVPGELQGKQVLITAGPTFESIDPVRFIGNRSSGKMGFALAQAAQEAGAMVTLISGPVALATPSGVKRIDIESAQEMAQQVDNVVDTHDIFISCAAVADFTPKVIEQQKVKKQHHEDLVLSLKPTVDIVADVASRYRDLFVVGFAAETENMADYAKAKLARKKLDMIAANRVGPNQGFGVEDNALSVFWHDGQKSLPLMHKSLLARELMTLIIERFYAKNSVKNS